MTCPDSDHAPSPYLFLILPGQVRHVQIGRILLLLLMESGRDTIKSQYSIYCHAKKWGRGTFANWACTPVAMRAETAL